MAANSERKWHGLRLGSLMPNPERRHRRRKATKDCVESTTSSSADVQPETPKPIKARKGNSRRTPLKDEKVHSSPKKDTKKPRGSHQSPAESSEKPRSRVFNRLRKKMFSPSTKHKDEASRRRTIPADHMVNSPQMRHAPSPALSTTSTQATQSTSADATPSPSGRVTAVETRVPPSLLAPSLADDGDKLEKKQSPRKSPRKTKSGVSKSPQRSPRPMKTGARLESPFPSDEDSDGPSLSEKLRIGQQKIEAQRQISWETTALFPLVPKATSPTVEIAMTPRPSEKKEIVISPTRASPTSPLSPASPAVSCGGTDSHSAITLIHKNSAQNTRNAKEQKGDGVKSSKAKDRRAQNSPTHGTGGTGSKQVPWISVSVSSPRKTKDQARDAPPVCPAKTEQDNSPAPHSKPHFVGRRALPTAPPFSYHKKTVIDGISDIAHDHASHSRPIGSPSLRSTSSRKSHRTVEGRSKSPSQRVARKSSSKWGDLLQRNMSIHEREGSDSKASSHGPNMITARSLKSANKNASQDGSGATSPSRDVDSTPGTPKKASKSKEQSPRKSTPRAEYNKLSLKHFQSPLQMEQPVHRGSPGGKIDLPLPCHDETETATGNKEESSLVETEAKAHTRKPRVRRRSSLNKTTSSRRSSRASAHEDSSVSSHSRGSTRRSRTFVPTDPVRTPSFQRKRRSSTVRSEYLNLVSGLATNTLPLTGESSAQQKIAKEPYRSSSPSPKLKGSYGYSPNKVNSESLKAHMKLGSVLGDTKSPSISNRSEPKKRVEPRVSNTQKATTAKSKSQKRTQLSGQ